MELLDGQVALRTLIANFEQNTLKTIRENRTSGFLRSRIELLEK